MELMSLHVGEIKGMSNNSSANAESRWVALGSWTLTSALRNLPPYTLYKPYFHFYRLAEHSARDGIIFRNTVKCSIISAVGMRIFASFSIAERGICVASSVVYCAALPLSSGPWGYRTMLFIMSHVTSGPRAGRRRRPIAALVQDTPPRRSDGFKIGSAARAAASVSSGGRQCQLSVVSRGRRARVVYVLYFAELRTWLCSDGLRWTRPGVYACCPPRHRRGSTISTSTSTAPKMRSKVRRRANWCGRTSCTKYVRSTGWSRTMIWWVDRYANTSAVSLRKICIMFTRRQPFGTARN